jgi:ferredoxin
MPNFRFSFDASECLNCGVCVDVCPVRCLDMTRPEERGPEPPLETGDARQSQAWMTVSPVQVGRCTGCMVCTMECPTDIIHITRQDDSVPYAPPQGPLVPEVAYDPSHWQPLSAFTRTSRKDRTLGDPWGPAPKWLPVRRAGTWRVWRTWQTHEDFQQAHGVERAETSSSKE